MVTSPGSPSLPPIIGLGGYSRTGKDSVADILTSAWGYTRGRYGEQVAQVLIDLNPTVRLNNGDHRPIADVFAECGYEDAKSETEVLRLMQDLGDAIKLRSPRFWGDQVLAAAPPGALLVFTGMRSPAEADAIRDQGGVVWRVHRPGVGPMNDHPNDKRLDSYTFDVDIHNDGGLGELPAKVLQALGRAEFPAPN